MLFGACGGRPSSCACWSLCIARWAFLLPRMSEFLSGSLLRPDGFARCSRGCKSQLYGVTVWLVLLPLSSSGVHCGFFWYIFNGAQIDGAKKSKVHSLPCSLPPSLGSEKQGSRSDLPGEKIQKIRLIRGHTGIRRKNPEISSNFLFGYFQMGV